MSDKNSKHVEELLSCYIDGQLSERERTEVKRLIRHDESLGVKLEQMQRQKELLGAMEQAKAPESLVDDVKAAIERKLILEEYSAESSESKGNAHLVLRRVLTAAIIMVLLGSLASVVVQVLRPVDPGTASYASRDDYEETVEKVEKRIAEEERLDVIASTFSVPTVPYSAKLDLETEQSIAVNNYIEKAIYKTGLIDYTTPPMREGNVCTYEVKCGADGIVSLVNELEAVWGRLSDSTLTINHGEGAQDVLVTSVSANQAASLFLMNDFDRQRQMAGSYVRLNWLVADMPGTNVLEQSGIAGGAVEPIATSPGDVAEYKQQEGIATVSLTIVVKGQ